MEAALAPTGVAKNERLERSIELLESVGLEQRANHLPAELSAGEQQRVAVARAFANKPRVLLLDEPTGNLDTATGLEIMQLFGRLHSQGNTLIVVTHEKEVARYANRIIYIRDGKIEKEERLK